MKDMNRIRVTVIGFIAALAASVMGVDKVQAQEFKIQGDLVSSYVWRGFYQTGVSFQPTLGFGIGGRHGALPILTEQAPRTVRLQKK